MTRTFEQVHRLGGLLPAQLRLLTAAAVAAVALASVGIAADPPAPSFGPFAAGSARGAAGHTVGASGTALDPRLASLAGRRPHAAVEAIVQFKHGVSDSRAAADARHSGAQVVSQLHIINALAVRASAAGAVALASNGDVHAVTLNSAVHPTDVPTTAELATTYNQTLGTTELWNRGFASATGAGVGVAVIDTGVDGNLPDFRGADGNSRVIATAVTNPAAHTVMDTYGHGTHVAGIIAGDGANRAASDPLRDRYAGVAPDAALIAIKVSDETGASTVLDVIYGLQFAVDHAREDNIRVINLSLDSTAAQSYRFDPLDAAAEAAWFHGLVVVAAAGNRGNARDAVDYAPANDPYVITVGATDEHDQTDPVRDTVASWSSRGRTQDGFTKPDVYAPGAHIVSVLAPGSVFAASCRACIVDGAYFRASGTSMAAPMISGLVADLLELYPRWTPDMVKGALTLGVGRFATGVVNALRAAAVAFPTGADRHLVPSTLINPASGEVDPARSTWSRSTWSTATGSLSAGFARSSWSCDCSVAADGSVDPSRSTWSTATWSATPDPGDRNG